MAWGYGSDEVSWGVVVSLFIQAALLVVLLGRGFRQRTMRRSPWRVVALGGAIVLNQALLERLSPSLGVGITSGALSLFVVIPLSLVNGVLVTFRAATRGGRAPLFLPLLLDIAFWAWRITSLQAGDFG